MFDEYKLTARFARALWKSYEPTLKTLSKDIKIYFISTPAGKTHVTTTMPKKPEQPEE